VPESGRTTGTAERRVASAAPGPPMTEWRRRAYLRVRRPAWADPAAAPAVAETKKP
jgi:hypothetical protein